MKVSFFSNYFSLTEEHSPIYPLVQRSLTKGGWSGREPSHEGEGSCKVQVSWLSLENGVCDVQRMVLLDKLAYLSCSGGDRFGKRVRRYNQNYKN